MPAAIGSLTSPSVENGLRLPLRRYLDSSEASRIRSTSSASPEGPSSSSVSRPLVGSGRGCGSGSCAVSVCGEGFVSPDFGSGMFASWRANV